MRAPKYATFPEIVRRTFRMLKLTSTILQLTDAAFQFYSHPQISSTALRERWDTSSVWVWLWGCLFFGPLCWCFIVTHTRHTTHTKTTKTLPTMTKPIWMDNGATMTSGLSAFSVITSTSRGQMLRKATRTERVQVHRHSLRQPGSLLVQRSGCSVNVHLTCE